MTTHPRVSLRFDPVILLSILCYTFSSARTRSESPVPAGLFVPAILCGSSFGRLVGEAVQHWADDDSIRPGTYALIGATAMLGGVTRMTISLTVILLETTNNIKYLLPIMIVLMIAKFVGDCFNISLYDMHVELNALPFVESHPPQDLSKLCASDVMSKPVVTFPLKPKRKEVQGSRVHFTQRISSGRRGRSLFGYDFEKSTRPSSES